MSPQSFPTPVSEEFVTRERMAGIMGISVPSFDRLRARGLRDGNPCPQQSWGLRKVVFEPSRVIAWAKTMEAP